MNSKNIIIMAAVVIIVGAASFYGGMTYQKSKSPFGSGDRNREFGAMMGNRQGGNGQGNAQGNSQRRMMRLGDGGEFINGEITAKDDKSITVKTRDGGSKIIFFSDTTTIGKTTDGSTADLENGKQVMVSGKANQDGTMAAQNIQIRPIDFQPSQGQ